MLEGLWNLSAVAISLNQSVSLKCITGISWHKIVQLCHEVQKRLHRQLPLRWSILHLPHIPTSKICTWDLWIGSLDSFSVLSLSLLPWLSSALLDTPQRKEKESFCSSCMISPPYQVLGTLTSSNNTGPLTSLFHSQINRTHLFFSLDLSQGSLFSS